MNESVQTALENLWVSDRDLQNEAYFEIMAITDKPIDWAYEAWDDVVKNLNHADNHNRAIAAQVVCNLAKSDPEGRILKDFEKLIIVTRDQRFVTARHCIQSLWKVGVLGKKQLNMYLAGLETRYKECADEKNCTLIRYDLLESLRNVYDVVKDENLKTKALELIETEKDVKYKKKYANLWKK